MCGVLGRAVAVRPGAHRPAAVDAVHMQRVIEARAEGGGRQGVADGARRDDLSRPQRVRGGQRQFLQVVGDQNGTQRRLFARDCCEGIQQFFAGAMSTPVAGGQPSAIRKGLL